MSGNPANAHVWSDADVFVGPTNADNPADANTPFPLEWELVGLLDGDQGFTQAREEDVNDIYAWGGILVKTTRRNFKLTVTFTALESNEVTKDLIWPGSEAGELKVPRPIRKKLAFETTDSDGNIRRLISKNEAEVTLNGDLVASETEVEAAEFQATIFPDANGVLWVEQEAEEVEASV